MDEDGFPDGNAIRPDNERFPDSPSIETGRWLHVQTAFARTGGETVCPKPWGPLLAE